jgi:hypothetical protein
VLQCLHAVPVHKGLAVILDSLNGAEQHAIMQEVQSHTGLTMISAVLQDAGVLNQANTIPLPMDEDW